MQSLITFTKNAFFATSSKSASLTPADTINTRSTFQAKYSLKDMLGTGGFGHIYSAVRKYDNKTVACKFIRRDKVPSNRWAIDSELGLVPMEVFIINNVRHEGVIEFFEIFNEDGYFIIIQELFGSVWNTSDAKIDKNTPTIALKTKQHKSMDLFELLDSRTLEEAEIKYIFRQIVNIIAHLYYDHNLIHGDLKDENILVDSNLKIKLIDFGGSKRLNGDGYLNAKEFYGTIEFASPEIVKGERYNGEKSEVWALGCLAYSMMYSKLPFPDAKATVRSTIASNPRKVDPLFLDLINQCLTKDASRRITLDNLVHHPWLF